MYAVLYAFNKAMLMQSPENKKYLAHETASGLCITSLLVSRQPEPQCFALSHIVARYYSVWLIATNGTSWGRRMGGCRTIESIGIQMYGALTCRQLHDAKWISHDIVRVCILNVAISGTPKLHN